jgi:hypothetical protein
MPHQRANGDIACTRDQFPPVDQGKDPRSDRGTTVFEKFPGGRGFRYRYSIMNRPAVKKILKIIHYILILLAAPASQRTTVLWFAGLTLSIGASLWFVRGADKPIENREPAQYTDSVPLPSRRGVSISR